MNKIYKVVKNQSGKQMVASELAKGKSKGIVSSLMAIVFAGALSTSVIAAPTLVIVEAQKTAIQALELARLNTGSSAEVSQNAINAASEVKALAQSANSNATRALNIATSALSTINDVQSEFNS